MAQIWLQDRIDDLFDELESLIGGWKQVLIRSVFIKGFLLGSAILAAVIFVDSRLGIPPRDQEFMAPAFTLAG